MPYSYVMRRAFFPFIKSIIAIFIVASLTACTLPLPDTSSGPQNPPEAPMLCASMCQTCCKFDPPTPCSFCAPPGPCHSGPSLVWAQRRTPIICGPCELEAVERKLNNLRCEVECGCIEAAVRLGHLYLVGDRCLPRDYCKALSWYLKAAEAGVAVAMVQMGHFYRDGVVVKRNICEAIAWYEKAACCGDTTAMLALGEIYQGWFGTKPNYKKALHWYEEALNMGSVEAEYHIGWLLAHCVAGECRVCEGLDILACAIESGNPEALVAYADLYYEGRVGPRNLELARDYYEMAARRGSAVGAFKLAMLYISEKEAGARRLRLANKWFLIAAEKGYAPAQMMVANMYRDASGVPRNYVLAARWYKRAAANGIGVAYAELGDFYHAGKGVPRILEEAVKYYQLASETGVQPYASLMLSVMYETGRGVPFNLAKSVEYYKRASREAGFLMALRTVGKRYALGYGLPQDWERAVYWYLLAANKGLTVAQVDLGDLFYSGEGVVANYSEAFRWYHKAAVRGNTYAQNMVGLMWLQDKCLPKGISPVAARILIKSNERKAACWIRKAALRGARQAQYQLGLLYWTGTGVPKNDPLAYAWIDTALEEVEDANPREIEALVREMSPEMKAEAAKLAAAYRLKYGLGKTIELKKPLCYK